MDETPKSREQLVKEPSFIENWRWVLHDKSILFLIIAIVVLIISLIVVSATSNLWWLIGVVVPAIYIAWFWVRESPWYKDLIYSFKS